MPISGPRPGDIVLLVSQRGKRYLRRLASGDDLHTNDGVLLASDVEAAQYGDVLYTHLGKPFRLLKPTLADLVKGVKRKTQILYPKDIGYVLIKLGVGAGSRVVECGSGSGSMSVALAHSVGREGRVYSYEQRQEFADLCRENLERYGLGEQVEHFVRDIADGFEDHGADALFLDVRTPWEYLDHAVAVVSPGSTMAFLLPTVSQVERLLAGLEAGPFDDLEVCEVLVRRWKPVPDRLRPDDRMVAHTGFLIFARHQKPLDKADMAVMGATMGTRERKREAAKQERLAAAEGGDSEQD